MKKDWTRLRATLDQISKLQPHSIEVWTYQAWNLSYNVSVAFDDYHDKFYWVIEGLNYMLDGVRVNDKEPRLYWDMAWFISNKIGRDDAAKYYRRLFSGERGDHGTTPPITSRTSANALPRPPAFRATATSTTIGMAGKAWFRAAESKINPPRYPVRGMATVVFYSDAPTCQFYYADNLEKDGIFGQVAPRAWKDAENEWHDFGEFPIETFYEDDLKGDTSLQLNRKEDLFDEAEEKKDRLDALAPGVRGTIEEELRSKLTPEYRAGWDQYREALAKYKEERSRGRAGRTRDRSCRRASRKT